MERLAQLAHKFTVVRSFQTNNAGHNIQLIVGPDSLQTNIGTHFSRIAGATRPYPTETLEVGFGGVRQLRTGYHDTGAGNEQHVVIDLMDPRVVLEERAVDGTTVRLRFRRLP